MQEILKFVEKSAYIEEFKILDFKRGESFAYIKLEILFKNSSRIHIREFITGERRKYSFHWVVNNLTTVRWDNSPHHKDIESFPHHLHINDELLPSDCTDSVAILTWIESLIEKKKDLSLETLLTEIKGLHLAKER
ncbi:MAG TPA: DUF6516 family protein [Mesotoga sp.]|jgi:hypothetical protein|nr:DUF6516 family protein [Thermotogota bacterium]HPB64556.1 DUF6516 family protein [Mesotoga sp.]HPI17671.1 DUF6516 family protein [Mesotoga sp.]HPM95100.1 DUF6516 family protein [Mesotoga sp.]HPX23082.1 DUF6516 family protein [Mesotoga sp.]